MTGVKVVPSLAAGTNEAVTLKNWTPVRADLSSNNLSGSRDEAEMHCKKS